MAANDIEIALKVTGEEKVAAAIAGVTTNVDKLEKELGSLAIAEDRAGRSQQKLTTSTQAIGESLGKFQSSIGIAAQTLSQFSPTVGRVTGILGQASGAATGLGAAFGPVGMAAGAAIGGLAALAVSVKTLSEEFAKTREEQGRFTRAFVDGFGRGGTTDRALGDFADAAAKALGFDHGWGQFMESAEDVTRDFGVAVRIMVDDAVQRLGVFVVALDGASQAVARGDFSSAAAVVSAGVGAETAIVGSQAARIESGQQAADREETLRDFLGSSRDGNKPPPGSRRGGGGGGGRDDYASRLEAASGQSISGPESNNFDIDADQASIALRGTEEQARQMQERIDLEIEYGEIQAERWVAERDAASEKKRDDEELSARQMAMMSAAQSAIGTVGHAITGAMKEGKAKRAATASLAAIEAAFEIGKGISAATIFDYVGAAGHFAAAAQFGIAAGMEARSGGGGGGGGSSGVAPRSSPTRSDQSSAGSIGGGGSYVINFGAPVVTATTLSELGVQIRRATDAAASRYGS